MYVNSIHKAEHGSTTGVYCFDDHLRQLLFNKIFDLLKSSGKVSLGVRHLFMPLKKEPGRSGYGIWVLCVCGVGKHLAATGKEGLRGNGGPEAAL